MSRRLEQAMKRLDDAVTRLEQAPLSAPSGNVDPNAVDPKIIKAEIAEIRSIVDQAMIVLNASEHDEGQVG